MEGEAADHCINSTPQDRNLKSLARLLQIGKFPYLATWNFLPSKLLGRSRVHSQNRQSVEVNVRPQLLAMDNIGDTVSDHKFHVESNYGAISGSAAA